MGVLTQHVEREPRPGTGRAALAGLAAASGDVAGQPDHDGAVQPGLGRRGRKRAVDDALSRGQAAARAVPRTDLGKLARLLVGSARVERLTRPRIAWSELRRDRVLVALAALLIAGLALRVWLTLVWRPAFVGYSDSGIYFEDVVRSVWTDPIRTVGYSMFLRVLHAVSPHLILVILVQHALGLVAAVLYFLAVRRCGGPRWLGLAPAAVIAVGGDRSSSSTRRSATSCHVPAQRDALRRGARPHRAACAGLPRPACARAWGVGPRRGGRDDRGDRAVAAVQRRAPQPAHARARPGLAGRLGCHRRGLRAVAQLRLGPERADEQQQLEPVRPRGAVGGLHQVHAAVGHAHAVRAGAAAATDSTTSTPPNRPGCRRSGPPTTSRPIPTRWNC